MHPGCPQSTVRAAVSWASKQVGKSYDWTAICGFALRRDWHDETRWFCSELVEGAMDHCGAQLLHDSGYLDRITPRDLYLSPMLNAYVTKIVTATTDHWAAEYIGSTSAGHLRPMMSFHFAPPRCAVCKRPVDHCWTAVSPDTLQITVAVECHGERRVSKLSLGHCIDASKVTVGQAFADSPAARTLEGLSAHTELQPPG